MAKKSKNNRPVKLKQFSMSGQELKAALIANSMPHEFYASGQYVPGTPEAVPLDPRYRAMISRATK